MSDYRSLVEYIVKNIVDNPDAVVVEVHGERGRAETVEIRLDPGDIGRVIGKSGRNIEAIRSVVKASAIKEHHRVNVEVITEDDLNGSRGRDRYADDDAEELDDAEPAAEATEPAVDMADSAAAEPAPDAEASEPVSPAYTASEAEAPAAAEPVVEHQATEVGPE